MRIIVALAAFAIGGVVAYQLHSKRNPPDREMAIATMCADSARARIGVAATIRLPDDVLDNVELLPEAEGEPTRYRVQTRTEYPTDTGALISTGFVCEVHLEGFFRTNVIDRIDVGNQYR